MMHFALSREEAEFIRDRIQAACSNSLLSFLALHCEPADTKVPYGSTRITAAFPNSIENSWSMHGAALSYNVQLAKLRNHDDLVAEH